MQHTTNYDLPQWEATDAVKREDVNGAMSAVDTAIAGAVAASAGSIKTLTGSYVGTAESQTITIGVQPKMMLLFGPFGAGDTSAAIAFIFPGHNLVLAPGKTEFNTKYAELIESEFILTHSELNMYQRDYDYLVFY